MEESTSIIRLRISNHDAHYAGNLVAGAKLLELLGDVATELLIRNDGDEGLFCAYDNIDFLAPVYGGDYLEASGAITKIGRTSRKMEFVIKKVITSCPEIDISACQVLEKPIIVCKASGTCVVPKEKQRY